MPNKIDSQIAGLNFVGRIEEGKISVTGTALMREFLALRDNVAMKTALTAMRTHDDPKIKQLANKLAAISDAGGGLDEPKPTVRRSSPAVDDVAPYRPPVRSESSSAPTPPPAPVRRSTGG